MNCGDQCMHERPLDRQSHGDGYSTSTLTLGRSRPNSAANGGDGVAAGVWDAASAAAAAATAWRHPALRRNAPGAPQVITSDVRCPECACHDIQPVRQSSFWHKATMVEPLFGTNPAFSFCVRHSGKCPKIDTSDAAARRITDVLRVVSSRASRRCCPWAAQCAGVTPAAAPRHPPRLKVMTYIIYIYIYVIYII